MDRPSPFGRMFWERRRASPSTVSTASRVESRPDRQICCAFRLFATARCSSPDRPDEEEVAAAKQGLSADFCEQDVEVEVSLVDRVSRAV